MEGGGEEVSKKEDGLFLASLHSHRWICSHTSKNLSSSTQTCATLLHWRRKVISSCVETRIKVEIIAVKQNHCDHSAEKRSSYMGMRA